MVILRDSETPLYPAVRGRRYDAGPMSPHTGAMASRGWLRYEWWERPGSARRPHSLPEDAVTVRAIAFAFICSAASLPSASLGEQTETGGSADRSFLGFSFRQ